MIQKNLVTLKQPTKIGKNSPAVPRRRQKLPTQSPSSQVNPVIHPVASAVGGLHAAAAGCSHSNAARFCAVPTSRVLLFLLPSRISILFFSSCLHVSASHLFLSFLVPILHLERRQVADAVHATKHLSLANSLLSHPSRFIRGLKPQIGRERERRLTTRRLKRCAAFMRKERRGGNKKKPLKISKEQAASETETGLWPGTHDHLNVRIPPDTVTQLQLLLFRTRKKSPCHSFAARGGRHSSSAWSSFFCWFWACGYATLPFIFRLNTWDTFAGQSRLLQITQR